MVIVDFRLMIHVGTQRMVDLLLKVLSYKGFAWLQKVFHMIRFTAATNGITSNLRGHSSIVSYASFSIFHFTLKTIAPKTTLI
jgi:hypothetical protein